MSATETAVSATSWAESFDGATTSIPVAGAGRPRVRISADQKVEIEEFLFEQAEMLDERRWNDFIDLFTPDGHYWMPISESQETGDGVPNIFYEDVDHMKMRAKRVTHPRAWSQKPPHRTTHVVSNVLVESVDATSGDVVVRSKFHMIEFRREVRRHFGGSYRHWLVRTPDGYRIKLQRVDLVDGEGTFDYVIQTWI